ncbi:hypothetical protein RclHR1_02780005 [Rhizophagus clarus]|uniref:Galactose oxidase n=1 Tax=Rhizophagus clarus TaxID=94130 RepID=A0A2Z6R6P8_9GLOM|nr:hypothetical protein RclHR1_02780005 [Rhizophagus clarus]
MSKNSLVHRILWILFQALVVVVNCQLASFKPNVLSRHTATLVDNKLYILAGLNISRNATKEFFYLDASVQFDTQKLSWQDLTNINMVPLHVGATSAKEDVTGVMGYNGKFYLWGGIVDKVIVDDMLILDTINLSWEKGSSLNAPTSRYSFGATLLPNNKIIYIGGSNDYTVTYDNETLNIGGGTASYLNEVYIYDTINDNWSKEATFGKIPSERFGLSAILGLDGKRVIIYGGAFINPGYSDTTLYVLDLTNYSWYIPKISGKIPTPRAFHEANVIGKYMVVSFGDGYDKTVESDILLLDINNNEEYIWTTTFDPSIPKNIMPPSSSSSIDFNNIVGAIVGPLLGGIFLSVGIFFIYEWKKSKQKQKSIYGGITLDHVTNDGPAP